MSEDRRQAAALQAGRQMIARGERPIYRVCAYDGRWVVDAMPWIIVATVSRSGAVDAARSGVGAWLDVPPDAFEMVLAE